MSPYVSERIERFGGLNLTDDPEEVGWNGAIDLLNVDFDAPGSVRSRWGLTKLNATAASANLIGAIGVLPGDQATNTYILSGRGTNDLVAYNAAGTLVASGVGLGNMPLQYASLGTGTTGPFVYIASAANPIKRFDGTTFSSPAGMPTAWSLAVTATSNRLVISDATKRSRIAFSNAGAPETWGANDFVDLHPNDGQKVWAVTRWRDLIFVFKDYKFFVFYGESTDSTGNPVFNYRTVDAGQGAVTYTVSEAQTPVCAAPDAVYFANHQGVWRTTGGVPEKVSAALDPLFQEQTLPYLTGFTGSLAPSSMAYCAGKLFVVIGPGTSSMLVYTIATGTWSIWDTTQARLANLTALKIGNTERVVYTGIGDDGYFRYFSPTASNDDGLAIASRYRSGFHLVPPGGRADGKRVARQWHLRGSGTATFGVAADEATAIPSSGGGAASSVSLTAARPNYRTSQMGNTFSWQASAASGAWRLDSVQADLA